MPINPSVQSQMLDRVVSLLNTTGWPAFRTRMASFSVDQLPAFNVLPDDGVPTYDYCGSGDWKFRFNVRCMAAAVDQVDAACDPLFVAASQVLLSDPTLGG